MQRPPLRITPDTPVRSNRYTGIPQRILGRRVGHDVGPSILEQLGLELGIDAMMT